MKATLALIVFATGLVTLAAATAASTEGMDLYGLWIVGGLLTLGSGLTLLGMASTPDKKKDG